jgi:apolipoprotein N-acyltransferase
MTPPPPVAGREPWREGLALLSGLLLFLSFPKFGHGAVAWFSLAPLLLAIAGASPRRATWLAYLTGVSGAIGILYWTALVVIQYGGLSLPLGIGVMLLLCLAYGLPTALFGWGVSRAYRAFGAYGLLLAPAIWVGTEILRAHTLFEFPWCLLGYSQHRWLPVIQIADVAGVYGVSFMVAAASAVLAFVLHERRAVERRMASVAFLLLLAATVGYGVFRLQETRPESGRIRIGIVQASIAQGDKWAPEMELANLDRHLALSRAAIAEKPQLLVWPESAVPFYFDYEPTIADPLRDFVRANHVSLIFGNDDLQPRAAAIPRVWVGAKVLAPNGELTDRYHKNRLVPFGEYVPLRAVFTLGGRIGARLVRNVGEFTPGAEASVVHLDGHAVGTFICYEAIFPDLVRQFSGRGAELLVNITNDGWYGTTSAPYQHFAMATFRAVENRKWLVRAANTGISGFVDPHGRVVRASSLFDRTAIVDEAAFVPGLTVYARIGDAFAWACLAIAAGVVLLSFRPSLRGAP